MIYLVSMGGIHNNILSFTSSSKYENLLILYIISATSSARDDGMLIFSLSCHQYFMIVLQAFLYPRTNTPMQLAACQSFMDIFSDKIRFVLNIFASCCLEMFSWMILGIIVIVFIII